MTDFSGLEAEADGLIKINTRVEALALLDEWIEAYRELRREYVKLESMAGLDAAYKELYLSCLDGYDLMYGTEEAAKRTLENLYGACPKSEERID